MRYLVGLLPLLACGIGMTVCLFVMRGMTRGHGKEEQTSSPAAHDGSELTALRQEVEDLRRRVADSDAAFPAGRR